MKKKYFKRFSSILFIILVIGFLIPQSLKMPVKDAGKSSYSQNSFWYYPWGKSVTHKGVDIFAKKNTPINSATKGIVLYTGELGIGGNIVYILGPKWRLHYYAHMDKIKTKPFSFVSTKTEIGTVGTSGNAAGKSPHLHYTIKTIIPYFWRIDKSKHGFYKMFFLNPIEYLNESFEN
jgi:peptidoglycan LD-endopeptidase LytH